VEQVEGITGVGTILRRVLSYSDKVFDLKTQWRQVRDCRPQPQIPSHVFPAVVFLMFLCRLRSFNELEQYIHQPSWRRWLADAAPSVDEIAYVSERMDLASVREVLAHVYTRLMRNKVVEPMMGWRVAAVDGHEMRWSDKRCCEECLTRTVQTKEGQRIQYYHRIVVFQLLGEKFRLLLDAELVNRGEDEVGAAKRMIERVLRRFPRSFDILTGDALYAQAPVLNLLHSHHKHAVMVLKHEHRDLLVDAQALFRTLQPMIARQGQTTFYQWDLDGFTSWPGLQQPVRVVRSLESTDLRERVGNQWVQSVQTHDWVWVTTLSHKQAPTSSIVHFGHARWQIENHGFNAIVTDWHADHYFHHHPVSLLVVWLTLFIAHAVFHSFVTRNLKPALRRDRPTIFWASQMAACFRLDIWWPPPL
jgi:hypothetical protein